MITVSTKRIQYTPSSFARASLLHLAETGSLTAIKPHISKRTNLGGFLLLVVEHGSGYVEVGRKRYELKTGNVAFINCSQPYAHCTSKDLWTIHWAHFDGPALLSVYNKFLERSGCPVFMASQTETYVDSLKKIYDVAAGSSFIRDMSINTILAAMLEKVMEDGWTERQTKAKNSVEEIRIYLENHYMENITLEGLSQQFFLERTYLGHLFSRGMGTTPIKYLNAVRLRKAKELLRFTDHTLAEIAEQVGFSSEHYISRVFKAIEGIPPREYRKRWK